MREVVQALFDDAPPEGAPVSAQPVDEGLRRLCVRLPRTMRFGTSTWNFPGWRGIVWSRGSGLDHLATEGLPAYSASPLFRTVGLDRNFYRALSEEEFASFAHQVPEDFRFIVKAPREVTDPVLRSERGVPAALNPKFLNPTATMERFIEPVRQGLGVRTGPLVFQFSPFPHNVLRTLDSRILLIERIGAYFEALHAALENIPSAERPVLAAEFRNYELVTPRMMRRLRETGVRPVVGLHPAMPGIRRLTDAIRCCDAPDTMGMIDGRLTGLPEANATWRLTGPLVVRWSLAAHQFYDTARRDWAPFDAIRAVDPATRALIASLVARAARSQVESFVAVNNKAEGCAPLTVRGIAEITDRILEADRTAGASVSPVRK